MSDRDHLRTAAELLEEASDATDGEPSERLAGFAEKVEGWADRDSGPDHGAMAGVLLKLDDIAAEVGGDTADTIQEARSAITEFRKTVEGV